MNIPIAIGKLEFERFECCRTTSLTQCQRAYKRASSETSERHALSGPRKTRALDTFTGMLSWALPLPGAEPFEFAKILKGIRSTGIETQSDLSKCRVADWVSIPVDRMPFEFVATTNVF